MASEKRVWVLLLLVVLAVFLLNKGGKDSANAQLLLAEADTSDVTTFAARRAQRMGRLEERVSRIETWIAARNAPAVPAAGHEGAPPVVPAVPPPGLGEEEEELAEEVEAGLLDEVNELLEEINEANLPDDEEALDGDVNEEDLDRRIAALVEEFNGPFVKQHRPKRRAMNPFCISDEHEILFVMIPKVGSSSVRAYMKRHLNATEVHGDFRALEEKRKGYFKFALLRDPVDRFRSGARELVSRHFGKGAQRGRFGHVIAKIAEGNETVLENLVSRRGDMHITRQSDFLVGINMDYLLPLDTLKTLIPISRKSYLPGGKKAIQWDSPMVSDDVLERVYASDRKLFNAELEHPQEDKLQEFLDRMELDDDTPLRFKPEDDSRDRRRRRRRPFLK